MMKRSGVPRLGPDEPSPMQSQNTQQIQQPSASNMHTLAPSAQPPQILGNTAMLSVGGGYRSRGAAPAVINYLKAGAVQYAPKQQAPPPPQPPPQHAPRIKQSGLGPLAALGRASPPSGAGGAGAPGAAGAGGGAGAAGGAPGPPPAHQFQRLKVEDALSYLDQVKYKFNTQPQVYNDFLDIMKEFKSQTIDTPGVITRVSNLFKGHPELIVGFNTFLPPGYKIEVQSNGQVSVSMPSPTGLGAGGVLLGVHHSPQQPQLVHLLPVPQSVSSAIVHNLSVSAAPTNTLHQISQAHQQIEAAAIHHAPGAAQPPAAGQHPPPAPPGQPVEFNHAIEYVNKIKSRFSRQPDKYKRFLEILHAYQRGHRDLKEPQAKQQTEQEVYSQVAKLFENQEDLLTEFGQFLPDAKAVTKPPETESHYPIVPPQQPRSEPSPERFPASSPQLPPHPTPHPHQHVQVSKHPAAAAPAPAPTPPHHLKRSPSFSSSNQLGAPPCKKPRWSLSDVSLADAAKLATPHDLGFFDRARRALKHHHVYDNFLRCLLLFTNEIISSSELLSVTAPFLSRHPELHKWLQDFLGPPSPPHTPTATLHTGVTSLCGSAERARAAERGPRLEPRPERLERLAPDRAPDAPPAMDIDLSTCKRLGTSYCALPREAASRRCSGRTALCKEVLNDTWVSFPTWSEDSTFVTSRKTQYEEYIYRCEDERFELDVVIETNASTIRVLEGVQKKLSRMSVCEAARYRLDECLGGASPTVHQRALRRIYGDKVAVDIIAGLKKNPAVAVPVVLRRLKAKEEEWREAQKGFNKQWREQNEKYYLKSLDHQGINFKQNDLKAMRSKSLFNELEAAVAARRGAGPHLALDYGVASRGEAVRVLRDAAELLIHHARRQPSIHKHDKQRIKQLLRHFLPDLLAHPRQPLSDDERDAEEKEEEAGSPGAASDSDKDKIKRESSESDNASDKSGNNNKNNKNDKENKPKNNNTHQNDWSAARVKRGSREDEPSANKTDVKCEPNRAEPNDSEDDYRDHPHNEARFVCTSSWYVFLRVHCALCQRLAGARRAAAAAPPDHHSAATALRLKPNNLPASASSPAQYYGALLELVRGVLDGNVEPAAYEDAAREMLGIRAYPAYTLDKLVASAVRQLQHCVSEPWSVRAAELAARGMRGSLAYVRRARRYLRQQHTAFLVKFYGGEECKVTFELLEGANGEGRTSPNHNDTSRLSPSNPRGACLSGAWGSRARGAAVFLVRNARARGGAGAAAVCGAAGAPRARRRKGLPRVLDAEECAAAGRVQGRPLQLYTAGALAAARNTHKRLAHARAHKFRAWLRGARAHQHALTF